MQNHKTKGLIVIDIGGTQIRSGISVDSPNFVVQTPKLRENILPTLFAEIEKVSNLLPPENTTIVVGCPGLISSNGTIEAALYWPASGIQLRKEIEDRFQYQTHVLNDANLQAGGIEFDYSNALYAVFGTGVGGAIILNGRIVLGERGFSGEFGHVLAYESDTQCMCGRKGCLDTIASGFWLEKTLGSNWWINSESSIVKDALAKAGLASGIVIGGILTSLDIQSVVLAGHIVRYPVFQLALHEGLQGCLVDAKVVYKENTWPLVFAGATRLSEIRG